MSRGRNLERRIEAVNRKALQAKTSCILKLATPIELTQSGLVSSASTVDYYGVVQGGLYFAMDAKETKQKTRFPKKNIHKHQLDYLLLVEQLGGKAYFLIQFTELDKDHAFLVSPSFILKYWGDSSIKYEDFPQDRKVLIDNYLDFL